MNPTRRTFLWTTPTGAGSSLAARGQSLLVAAIAALAGCRTLARCPLGSGAEACLDSGRRLAAIAAAGDGYRVEAARAGAAEYFGRACDSGSYEGCRQSVLYWRRETLLAEGTLPFQLRGARTGELLTGSVSAGSGVRARSRLEHYWLELVRLARARAEAAAHRTHEVAALWALRAEFPGSRLEEPGLYEAAMAATALEVPRDYLRAYASESDRAVIEHASQVRRHLAEIELAALVQTLGQSADWAPLREFHERYPDLAIEEPAVFERARQTADIPLLWWYEQTYRSVWYEQTYRSVDAVTTHMDVVRSRHGEVVLQPILGEACSVAQVAALARAATPFAGTAAVERAATRALECATGMSGLDRTAALALVARGFQGTPQATAALALGSAALADSERRARQAASRDERAEQDRQRREGQRRQEQATAQRAQAEQDRCRRIRRQSPQVRLDCCMRLLRQGIGFGRIVRECQ